MKVQGRNITPSSEVLGCSHRWIGGSSDIGEKNWVVLDLMRVESVTTADMVQYFVIQDRANITN